MRERLKPAFPVGSILVREQFKAFPWAQADADLTCEIVFLQRTPMPDVEALFTPGNDWLEATIEAYGSLPKGWAGLTTQQKLRKLAALLDKREDSPPTPPKKIVPLLAALKNHKNEGKTKLEVAMQLTEDDVTTAKSLTRQLRRYEKKLKEWRMSTDN